MIALMRMGLTELYQRRSLTMAMALAFAVTMFLFLALTSLQAGLRADYPPGAGVYLVVQESQSLGELYGSQLPMAVADQLTAAGVSRTIPEIHTLVGTSARDAILLRGISLDDYMEIEPVELIAGLALATGDPPRLAMIGYRLAETRQVNPGDTIQLRGRPFTVAGVFQTGTYADNEAWISIPAAQALLGWDGEVSIFLIPDEGIFKEGDSLPGGISVIRKGEVGASLPGQWAPLLNLFSQVARLVGIAAAVALMNLLWRLAWLRRRELAILRAIGFGKQALASYLAVQGFGIAYTGAILGSLGAALLVASLRLDLLGLSVQPVISPGGLLASLGWITGVAGAGVLAALFWVSRLNLADLLRNQT